MVHVLALIHAGGKGIKRIRAYEAKAMRVVADHGGMLLSAFAPRG